MVPVVFHLFTISTANLYEIYLNILRPGDDIVGLIFTVVKYDYLGPCDHEMKKHIKLELGSQDVKMLNL